MNSNYHVFRQCQEFYRQQGGSSTATAVPQQTQQVATVYKLLQHAQYKQTDKGKNVLSINQYERCTLTDDQHLQVQEESLDYNEYLTAKNALSQQSNSYKAQQIQDQFGQVLGQLASQWQAHIPEELANQIKGYLQLSGVSNKTASIFSRLMQQPRHSASFLRKLCSDLSKLSYKLTRLEEVERRIPQFCLKDILQVDLSVLDLPASSLHRKVKAFYDVAPSATFHWGYLIQIDPQVLGSKTHIYLSRVRFIFVAWPAICKTKLPNNYFASRDGILTLKLTSEQMLARLLSLSICLESHAIYTLLSRGPSVLRHEPRQPFVMSVSSLVEAMGRDVATQLIVNKPRLLTVLPARDYSQTVRDLAKVYDYNPGQTQQFKERILRNILEKQPYLFCLEPAEILQRWQLVSAAFKQLGQLYPLPTSSAYIRTMAVCLSYSKQAVARMQFMQIYSVYIAQAKQPQIKHSSMQRNEYNGEHEELPMPLWQLMGCSTKKFNDYFPGYRLFIGLRKVFRQELSQELQWSHFAALYNERTTTETVREFITALTPDFEKHAVFTLLTKYPKIIKLPPQKILMRKNLVLKFFPHHTPQKLVYSHIDVLRSYGIETLEQKINVLMDITGNSREYILKVMRCIPRLLFYKTSELHSRYDTIRDSFQLRSEWQCIWDTLTPSDLRRLIELSHRTQARLAYIAQQPQCGPAMRQFYKRQLFSSRKEFERLYPGYDQWALQLQFVKVGKKYKFKDCSSFYQHKEDCSQLDCAQEVEVKQGVC